MEPVVAAFDVDGTLTVRDCVVPFLFRVGGLRGVLRAMSRPALVVGALWRRDRDQLKAHFVRSFLAGVPQSVLDARGEDFARRVASSWMRADVAARLRRHQDEGHVVLLVSASLDPYLVPLGEMLEVDAVLCTRVEFVDEIATGELTGANCRGAEKVARLREWGLRAGLSGDAWLSFAYGDSAGDREMLALATEGHNVSRSEVAA